MNQEKSMNRLFRTHAALALALFALGTASVALADHGNKDQTRLKTRLAGAAIAGKTPEGSAEFRTDSSKGRTELKVEVENVNLPDGTKLDVSVAGTVIGQITLKLGEGELELNSQDGEPVPAVVKGNTVTVANAGATVLAGAF